MRECPRCGELCETDARNRAKMCGSCKQLAYKNKVNRIISRYHDNPEAYKLARIKRRLEAVGLGLDWYNTRSGVCGICKTTEPGGRGSWHIDHDHSCCNGCKNCLRGVLCHYCNLGVGMFRDDPELLREAAAWVERKVITA